MRAARRTQPAAALLAPLALALAFAAPAAQDWATTYNVFAIRYATLPDFPVASLVAGADPSRRMDIAMMVWLLEAADGRTVMVDAGFYRDHLMERWRPRDYVRPSDAIAKVGIRPDEVLDIIVTHVHWDHLDGADLFPNATVWIQKDEYDYYVNSAGRPRYPGIDPADAAMLAELNDIDRVQLVDGDEEEILPGITVYTGGRHTHASQYVGVQTTSGTVVLASDNLYLYENLDRGVPIAQTVDAEANRRAQSRMRALASNPSFIVPGHDPAVFARFPLLERGVAAIPR